MKRFTDDEPQENFQALIQEAKRILDTGDDDEAIAFLLGVPVERVKGLGDAQAKKEPALSTGSGSSAAKRFYAADAAKGRKTSLTASRESNGIPS